MSHLVKGVEIQYIKYLKYILGMHKNTCKNIVYGELGVYPVDIIIKTSMISNWTRLITGIQSKLPYVMYHSLIFLNFVGLYTSDWSRGVQATLNNRGMSEIWLSQEVPNPVWLKEAVELNLKDQWITIWHANEWQGLYFFFCNFYVIAHGHHRPYQPL